MVIRSAALTDEMVEKIVAKYISSRLEGTIDVMESQMDEHGDNYKNHRESMLEHYKEEKSIVTETVLDRGGIGDLFGTAAMLLIQYGKQFGHQSKADIDTLLSENKDNLTPELKKFVRAVGRGQKYIYETIEQAYETGDSDYHRQERAKPKVKTLKLLIEEFHAEKTQDWKDAASTIAIHNRILHMLGDVRLDEITRKMCVELKEDLKEYPLKNADFKTPWRDLSKRKTTRLAERTQNQTISELTTLFEYANNNNMGIGGNPAKGLLRSKAECKRVKVREPYTVEELNRMVLELAKVDRAKKPETFWIPLLLLFTGARSNDVCMLRCDDVVQSGGSWIIHFRNNLDFNQGTKNSDDRQAPVHSSLLGLGFIDFCESQRRAGQDRLFSNLKLYRQKWNVDFGKQFSRTFKPKFLTNYTPKELSAKDLHTFRGTFISWFVKSDLVNSPKDIRTLQSIVGHCEVEELKFMQAFLQKASLTIDEYGGGFNVEQKAFMEQLDYGIDLGPLLIK